MAVRTTFRTRYGTRGSQGVTVANPSPPADPVRVQLRVRYGTRGSNGLFISEPQRDPTNIALRVRYATRGSQGLVITSPAADVRVQGGLRHDIRGVSGLEISLPKRVQGGTRHDIRGVSGLIISLPQRVRGGLRHDIRGVNGLSISIPHHVEGGLRHDIRGVNGLIISLPQRVRGGLRHDIRGVHGLIISIPHHVEGGLRHDIRGVSGLNIALPPRVQGGLRHDIRGLNSLLVFGDEALTAVFHDVRGSGNLLVSSDDVLIPISQRSILVPIAILQTIPEVNIVSQNIGWENPGRTIHRSIYTGEEIVVNRGIGRLHGSIQIGELSDEIDASKVEAWLAELVNRSTGCELPVQRTTPSSNFDGSVNSVEFDRGRIITTITGNIDELSVGHFIRSNHRTLIVTDIIASGRVVLVPSVPLPINATLLPTRTVRVRLRSQEGQYFTPREPDWYGPWNLNWVEIPEEIEVDIPIMAS